MADIATRSDLEILLSDFYARLLDDVSVRYIFTNVADINLAEHLPVIVDFWEMALFGTGDYRNNVLAIHKALHERSPFSKMHFDVWLGHLYASVDNRFAGPVVEMMKTKALSIATVMQIKMQVT